MLSARNQILSQMHPLLKPSTLSIAGYTIQARPGIPHAIGFFSPPGLELNQFAEGFQLLLVDSFLAYRPLPIRFVAYDPVRPARQKRCQEQRQNRWGRSHPRTYRCMPPSRRTCGRCRPPCHFPPCREGASRGNESRSRGTRRLLRPAVGRLGYGSRRRNRDTQCRYLRIPTTSGARAV